MKLSEYPFLKANRGKAVILDTNLLLLHLCCQFDFSLLQSFKRLNGFEPSDVVLLAEILKLFPERWTTPHVLTEVSNLANSLPSWKKAEWAGFFSGQIRLLPELCDASSTIAADTAAMRFGITDAALIRLAATHLVLTIDWPLTGLLESRGLPVLNFNHFREIEFSL